jgi:hypothetical protein
MFNLFRHSPTRPALPKARLSLEVLDRRDVPSAYVGDWCGNDPEFRFPKGGWVGPVHDDGAIIVIGGTDPRAQKVSPACPPGTQDGAIIIVNNLPTANAQKV